MKHCYLSKLFVLMLLVLHCMSAKAYFVCDIIKYEVLSEEDKTVELVGTTTKRFVDVVIPSSVVYEDVTYTVTSIGDRAFYGCSALKEIKIPGSVAFIGNGAFYDCSALERIVVAEENNVYDSRGNCNAIINTETGLLAVGCKNTVIPDDITGIGSGAFYNCTDLTSVVLPDGVIYIGEESFNGCSALRSIEIPNSITYFGISAFNLCI